MLYPAFFFGGILEKLKFYNIDNDYINYLYEFDKKVPFNKGEKRPYIGIVIKIENVRYFAPLFSPKKVHSKYSDNPTYMRIGGQYGIVRFNNMLPVAEKCLKYINFDDIDDEKYRNLILAQNVFIQRNTERIRKKAEKLYKWVTKDKKKFFVDLSCDFKLLEEKALLYEKGQ